MKSHQKKNIRKKGQVTLEFTFCFIIVLLFFYSVVKAMQWAGISLVFPVSNYQKGIAEYHAAHTGSHSAKVEDQLRGIDDKLPGMQLVYNGTLME